MRWQEWLAFTVLCLWAASKWLLGFSSEGPRLERLGVAFAIMGLATAVVSVIQGKRSQREAFENYKLRTKVALGSLLYFAVPAVLLERTKQYVSEITVTAVFALVPVAVVVLWGAASRGGLRSRRLVPALAGLAGVLLLLPYELPQSARGWESLAEALVAMLLVAYASAWMNEWLSRVSFAGSLVLAGSVNAVVLLGLCWVRELMVWRWSEWSGGALIMFADAASVVLTLWLLRAVNPVRFSARFLMIPLVTIVEGLILVRPEFSGRLLAGMILLIAGVGWLLTSGQAVEEEILTLR